MVSTLRSRPVPTTVQAVTRSRSIRRARAAGVITIGAVIGLMGCGAQVPEMEQPVVAAPAPVSASPLASFGYTGGVQTWQIPSDVSEVQITALGGQGGTDGQTSGNSVLGWGAQVTGTIAVQPGQTLQVSVGGDGGAIGSSTAGGWGGLGANGGAGKAEKDHLRNSAGGGGATTIQLTDTHGQNPQTILIAGGGGGMGGASGGAHAGEGGNAGCGAAYTVHGTTYPFGPPTWTGSDGTSGAAPLEGKGGKAAAGPGMAGGTGIGGSGLGGDGGGGGGGLLGGAAGTGAKGTSAAGGGGGGSSATYAMTNTSITCAAPSANQPAVIVTATGAQNN